MSDVVTLDKDDRELAAIIERGKSLRRGKGVSEPEETFDLQEATREWQRMQQARSAPWTYHIVIEYKDGAYHAYALSFPEVTAWGDTLEAVKENMVQALQTHFATLQARGETVPSRDHKRVELIEVSPEKVSPQVPEPAVPA